MLCQPFRVELIYTHGWLDEHRILTRRWREQSNSRMNPNSTEHRVERSLHQGAQATFLLAMYFALLVSMVACSILPEPGSPPTPNSPLQTPTLNAKETFLQKIKQTVESARIKPPTPEPLVPIPGSTPAGAGAIVKVQPPFSNSMYHIENTWYTDLDSKRRLYVYAGSMSAPGGGYTDQGIVIIQVPSSTGEILPISQYLTPEKLGSVRVVGAVGDRLILQSTSGTTFYFDVPSRQFVPSLTWVSPLSTPSPKLATPEPTVFSPPLDSTPAGAGAIVSMIPLLYTNDFRFENTWYKDTEGGNVRTYVHGRVCTWSGWRYHSTGVGGCPSVENIPEGQPQESGHGLLQAVSNPHTVRVNTHHWRSG